jgi:hypothetical protein
MKQTEKIPFIKQTNKQRKADQRADAIVLPTPKSPRTPPSVKLVSRLRGADLAELRRWEKRFFAASVFYCKAFTEWRAEVPSVLPDEDWPDRGNLVELAKCYDVVIGEYRRRRIAFTPRSIVMPSAPPVFAAAAITPEALPGVSKIAAKLKRVFGFLAPKAKETKNEVHV